MQYVFNISLPVLPDKLESVRLNIGCPVVRTDGRAVYCHVITKFSGMGRFTYPWCSAGALRAPELRYNARLSVDFKVDKLSNAAALTATILKSVSLLFSLRVPL